MKFPETSYWGTVNGFSVLDIGVFRVRGGIMVDETVAMKNLTVAAQKIGIYHEGYLCYEEDRDDAVVLYELMEKGFYRPSPNKEVSALYRSMIEDMIFKHNYNYLLEYRKECNKAKKQIVILNGSATVGKDSFVNALSRYVTVKHISMCDLAKKALLTCGWNGIKDEQSRKALSDIKIALDNFEDSNFSYITQNVKKFLFDYPEYDGIEYLCIDMREPKDIQRFKCFLINVPAILIKNPRVSHLTSNIGDAGVNNYAYDYCISNDGTKDDLFEKAKALLDVLEVQE